MTKFLIAAFALPLLIACGGAISAPGSEDIPDKETNDTFSEQDVDDDNTVDESTDLNDDGIQTDIDDEAQDTFTDTEEDEIPDSDTGLSNKPQLVDKTTALIVTTETFREAFERLALFHSLTGIPTSVVTVEEICSDNTLCHDDDPTNDTPKAIKEYLKNIDGLRYALLGGDDEVLPTRVVYDEYNDQLEGNGVMQKELHTDYYYADFSAWDSNHNGVYAEESYNNGHGTPIDIPDYRPEIAVGRLPVSTVEEVERYTSRVISYTTRYNTSRIKSLLFLSNVAAKYMGISFDSAEYFEQPGRTGSLIPPDFAITKMYATKVVPGSVKLTVDGEIKEIEAGHNIIVHLGHGSRATLTTSPEGNNRFSSDKILTLENSDYPIFISCSCEAGQYYTDPYYFTDDPEQKTYDDSAGEYLINAPNGGAIAYIGNTEFGLGLAGGNQFIDAMIFYAMNNREVTLGDTFFAGHAYMPDHDDYTLPVVGITKKNIVDKDSYEWTQKVVVLLGDPMIPLWLNDKQNAPEISVTKISDDGTHLSLSFSATPFTPGSAFFDLDGSLYRVEIPENNYQFTLPSAQHIAVGYVTNSTIYSWKEEVLP